MRTIESLLHAAVERHRSRRLLEALLRAGGGLLLGGAVALRLGAPAPPLGLSLGGVVAAVAIRHGWRQYRRHQRTPVLLARRLDRSGNTDDLIAAALSIETGRSVGSDALGQAIRAQAQGLLPTLLPTAEVPVRVPRSAPVAAILAAGLWMAPLPDSVPAAPGGTGGPPGPSEALTEPGLLTGPPPAPPLEPAIAGSGSAPASDQQTGGSGVDQRSSGGAESSTGSGVTGGAGSERTAGTGSAADADGAAAAQTTASGGDAREAGASGVTSDGPGASTGKSTPSEARSTATDEAAPIAAEDGNTTGLVEQTAALTDSVRSNADTLHLQEGTPDDLDAQTRSVAATLDLQTDGPQFFDATESEDAELNGKGGAGGWTIGLSQPGEGGVNDASGSTWRTEAGIPDPPDWTDAPGEWVDAAWQDTPAGVIRRVKDGQVGGSGSTDYAEAWLRYAAVAEEDSARPHIPPGRRDLVRQYFLAIAPKESP